MSRPVRVRFAPSPTGKLHVGNVRAALWNWLFARKSDGEFMLRIDDTDQVRSTKAFEEGIHKDLAWLGLKHDLTASQSSRFNIYDEIADKLRAAGLLYACYETAEELDRKRKLQRARSLPPVYDRAGLNYSADDMAAFKAEERQPHWRFKLSQTPVRWNDLIRGETVVDTASVSDPVLIRADGQYLYTLPSCIDDMDFAISHVIRGEDHVTNTAVQIEVFRALADIKEGATPPEFAHHSLLIGSDGEGLSKRVGSLSIEAMREQGLEPQAITSLLAKLGTADPVVAQNEMSILIESFDFSKMGRAPARFDEEELLALNGKLLHEKPYDEIASRVEPLGASEALWLAVRANITRVDDVKTWVDIISGEITPMIENADFTAQAALCVPEGPITADSWSDFVGEVKEKTGAKGKQLFMPLRQALTGLSHGPEMGPIFALIGRDKVIARLQGNKA